MSRRKEGRSPNRWAEKEAGDGKYFQGAMYLRCSTELLSNDRDDVR